MKKTKITDITKLDGANNAATSSLQDCILVVTKGDITKTLDVSGLSVVYNTVVVGRNSLGVFPLKGKILNTSDATHAHITNEIMNLVEILGLK